MGAWKIRIILGISLVAIGCTKATPEFETLDSAGLPRPQFKDGSSWVYTKPILVGSKSGPIARIDGKCDPKINSLIATIPQYSLHLTSSEWTASVTCSSARTFYIDLEPLATIFPTHTFVEGEKFTIEVRGVTAGGTGSPSFIVITYNTGAAGFHISSGASGNKSGSTGVWATSTNFSAQIRMTHQDRTGGPGSGQSFPGSSSGSYSVKPPNMPLGDGSAD